MRRNFKKRTNGEIAKLLNEKDIIKRYRNGEKIDILAAELRIHSGTLFRWLNKFGVVKKGPIRSEGEVKWLEATHSISRSLDKIVEKLPTAQEAIDILKTIWGIQSPKVEAPQTFAKPTKEVKEAEAISWDYQTNQMSIGVQKMREAVKEIEHILWRESNG